MYNERHTYSLGRHGYNMGGRGPRSTRSIVMVPRALPVQILLSTLALVRVISAYNPLPNPFKHSSSAHPLFKHLELPPEPSTDPCFKTLTESSVQPCEFDYEQWQAASNRCRAGWKYSVFICRCINLAQPVEIACRTPAQQRIWRNVQAEKQINITAGCSTILLAGTLHGMTRATASRRYHWFGLYQRIQNMAGFRPVFHQSHALRLDTSDASASADFGIGITASHGAKIPIGCPSGSGEEAIGGPTRMPQVSELLALSASAATTQANQKALPAPAFLAYHRKSATDMGFWGVGPSVYGNVALASFDRAAYPESVRSPWEVWNGSTWARQPSFAVGVCCYSPPAPRCAVTAWSSWRPCDCLDPHAALRHHESNSTDTSKASAAPVEVRSRVSRVRTTVAGQAAVRCTHQQQHRPCRTSTRVCSPEELLARHRRLLHATLVVSHFFIAPAEVQWWKRALWRVLSSRSPVPRSARAPTHTPSPAPALSVSVRLTDASGAMQSIMDIRFISVRDGEARGAARLMARKSFYKKLVDAVRSAASEVAGNSGSIATAGISAEDIHFATRPSVTIPPAGTHAPSPPRTASRAKQTKPVRVHPPIRTGTRAHASAGEWTHKHTHRHEKTQMYGHSKNRGPVQISTHLMDQRHPILAQQKSQSRHQQQQHEGNSAAGGEDTGSGNMAFMVCAVATLLMCTYFHVRSRRSSMESNVAPEQLAFARNLPATTSTEHSASASASRMMALAQAQRQQFATLTQQNLHASQAEGSYHRNRNEKVDGGTCAGETLGDRRLNAIYDEAS